MDLFELLGTITINNSQANKALDDTSKQGKLAEGKLGKVFTGIGKGALALGKTMVKGMAIAGGAIAGALIAATASSREFREDLNRLDAAFKSAGKTTEQGRQAFEGFYKVLGETDRSIEAVNHLAQLTNNEKELAMWTDICAGVSATFGDSLPIEGLTEAANETAKVGEVTGTLADALNWVGISQDDFNKQLASLSTEEERATLITETLSKAYEKSAQNFNEMNADVMASREATLKWENALASVGSTIEPLITKVKSFGADALQGVADGLKMIADGDTEAGIAKISETLINTLETVANKIVEVLPTILNSFLPLLINGLVSLINGVVQVLPTILSGLMAALPVLIQGLETIFNALVAALPQLMEVLVSYLPQLIPQLVNALLNMVLTLLAYLPEIIQPIITYLPAIIISIVNALLNALPQLIDGLITLVLGIVNALPEIVQRLVDAIPQVVAMIVTALLNALPQLIAGAIQLVFGLVKALPQILSSLNEALPNAMKGIWNGVKNVFSDAGSFFGNVWGKMKDAFGSVGDWFKNTFSNAWQKVKDVFSSGGKIFDGIKDGIANTFKTIVNGLIGGINKVISVPFKAINKALTSIRNVEVAGFKPFTWINTISIPQIPKLYEGGVLKRGQLGLLEGDGAEAVVPLERNTQWIGKVADTFIDYIFGGRNSLQADFDSRIGNTAQISQRAVTSQMAASNGKDINNKLQRIIEMLQQFFPEMLAAFLNQTMILEDGTLVAKLAPKMDVELGKIAIKKGRGR